VPVPVPYVDVLCGGFPCQDISLAGRGAGLAGERSGLWREFARLIGELRPRYVIVENVPALTSRGLDVVLGDLAARGFDAEWDHLPASAFGAPHARDRIWLVAYRDSEGEHGRTIDAEVAGVSTVGDPDAERRNGRTGQLGPRRRREPANAGWWLTEPDVGRVAHGIPARVDRLRSLGNALVPQIAEWLGRQILEWEGQRPVTEMPYKRNGCDLCGRSAPLSRVELEPGTREKLARVAYVCDAHREARRPLEPPSAPLSPQAESLF